MTLAVLTTPARPKRRRRGWLLGYVLLVGLLLSRTLLSGSTQRLRELPYSALPLASRQGMVLLAGPDDPRGLQGIPERDGAVRTLLPPIPTQGAIAEHWLTPTGAILRTDDPAAPSMQPGSVPPPWGGGIRRTRLWSAALDGTPARELLKDLRMESAAPSGDACFWLRPSGPGRGEGAARSRSLMRTPLTGGLSQEICSGVPAATRLEPLAGGVTWTVFQRGTFRMDRCVALPPSYEVALLEDCAGRPDLLDGRLYWLQFTPKGFFTTEPARLELTSAGVDGRDRKVVADLLQRSEWLPLGRFLGVHRERAYCLVSSRPRPGKASQSILCEVREAEVEPVATLSGEAGPAWFDGDSLYYSRMETHDNWLNWSKAGLTLKSSRALYRLRLPA